MCPNGPAEAGAPDRRWPQVHITVDLPTLIGLTDHPAELAGYGPVAAGLARHIAVDNADQPWTYAITNSDGRSLATGALRRRPTTAQRRTVTTRNPGGHLWTSPHAPEPPPAAPPP